MKKTLKSYLLRSGWTLNRNDYFEDYLDKNCSHGIISAVSIQMTRDWKEAH